MSKKISSQAYRCQCEDCLRHPRGAIAKLHRSLNRLLAALDEKNRRLVAGLWALRLGRGGIQRTVEITGLSRPTVARGQREVQPAPGPSAERIRRPGGGRSRIEKNNPASWRLWKNC